MKTPVSMLELVSVLQRRSDSFSLSFPDLLSRVLLHPVRYDRRVGVLLEGQYQGDIEQALDPLLKLRAPDYGVLAEERCGHCGGPRAHEALARRAQGDAVPDPALGAGRDSTQYSQEFVLELIQRLGRESDRGAFIFDSEARSVRLEFRNRISGDWRSRLLVPIPPEFLSEIRGRAGECIVSIDTADPRAWFGHEDELAKAARYVLDAAERADAPGALPEAIGQLRKVFREREAEDE